ncbi:ATP-binding cassette domain-containing protein [Pseudodesulfovibrio sp. F-1]|uniref:ATP-binding cassette domain-containing protein n=1 Tax=Pseudodesulfovibrio alkaliphilus TaxID=2661613 RepID=A0A7K1KS35_9BACT|nr:ABC transporter ATP-binding protein [Pseudodesulfovibrio alkaliphilus]MUM78884.1 ATP-binding cassette domain-containing protein [Pseudodesulfovibrio alkaliphilus]
MDDTEQKLMPRQGTGMIKSLNFISEHRSKLLAPLAQNTAAALLLTASYAVAVQLILSFLHPSQSGLPWAQIIWGGLIANLLLGYFYLIRGYTRNSMRIGHQISTTLRLKLCSHIQKLPLSFLKKNTPSKITGTLLNDMVYTESVFSVYIYELAASLLIPCLLMLALAIMNWQIAAAALCAIFTAIPFLLMSYRSASDSSPEYMEAKAKTDHSMQEYLEGIRELKGADRTGERFLPFIHHNDAMQRISLNIETRLGIYCQTYTGILDLIFVVIFVLGSLAHSKNNLSLAVLIFLLCMANRLIEPMQMLGMFLTEFRFALGALGRVMDIFKEKPLPTEIGFKKPADGSFSFNSVSFSYGGEQVLKNICIHAPEGSVTALVGESGSGKTTVTNLLLRFWDADTGSIHVGGTDIKTMDQQELYSLFSVVFQDVYLFNDTIMNNIRMGKSNATDDEVIEAARLACCHDFIMMLKDGYNTGVGQNGAMLSGGERQRIAIARAILAQAPILVLDEATASIDPENELQIQRGLNNLIQGRTLLVIAHRLSTIRYADQILVLQQGRIVEQGTHDELIELKGSYHHLWEAQESIKSWSVR